MLSLKDFEKEYGKITDENERKIAQIYIDEYNSIKEDYIVIDDVNGVLDKAWDDYE